MSVPNNVQKVQDQPTPIPVFPKHTPPKSKPVAYGNVQGSVFVKVVGSGITASIPSKVQSWVRQLGNWDPKVRAKAVEALGKSRSKYAAIPLVMLLTDPNKDVSQKAWKALSALSAIPAVKQYVKSKIHEIRDGLNSWDDRTRKSHVYALGIFQDTHSLPKIRRVLRKDKKWHVSGAAAWALAKMKDAKAVGLLLKEMYRVPKTFDADDFNSSAQHNLISVVDALKRLGQNAHVKAFIRKCKKDIFDSNWKKRARAAWVLYTLNVKSASPALLKQLKVEKKPDVAKKIVYAIDVAKYKPAIPVLLKILKSPMPGKGDYNADDKGIVIYQAAQALGAMNVRKAIPIFEKIVKQRVRAKGRSDYQVEWSYNRLTGAVNALGALKVKAAIPDMLARYKKDTSSSGTFLEEAFIYALSKMGDSRHIKPLIDIMSGYNSFKLRNQAARALAAILKRGKVSTKDRKKAEAALALHEKVQMHMWRIAQSKRAALELRRKMLKLAK